MSTDPRVYSARASTGAVEVRLLGGVTASRDDLALPIGGPQRQLLLAILIAAEGQVVPTDELVRKVWGDDGLPERLHEAVYDLRRGLGPAHDLLLRVNGGYRSGFDRGQVDIHRFHDQGKRGKALVREDPEEAVRAFAAALAEWGDPGGRRLVEPLAGLEGQWADGYRETLLRGHRDVRNACWDAEFRLGRLADQMAPLTAAADAEPLDEAVAGLLMIALYQSGQQRAALDRYQTIRALLDEDGLTPSPGLVKVQLAVLNHDPAIAPPERPTPAPNTRGSSAGADRDHGRSGEPPGGPEPGRGRPGRATAGFGSITVNGDRTVIAEAIDTLHTGDVYGADVPRGRPA
jgi:DNA-binding SARP family transcriptional activator